jgi:hypothetical protein
MSYTYKYDALHRCAKGHEFRAWVSPFDDHRTSRHRCPQCLEDFLQTNVPDGFQVDEAKKIDESPVYL